MGGKPKTTTPADMRLAANKKKFGSVANRNAGKAAPSTPPPSMPLSPMMPMPPKKGSH